MGSRPGTAQLPLLVCPAVTVAPAVCAISYRCCDCAQLVWVSLVMAPAAQRGELVPCCESCTGVRTTGARVTVMQHPLQAEAGMTSARFVAMSDQILARVRDVARDRAGMTAPDLSKPPIRTTPTHGGIL